MFVRLVALNLRKNVNRSVCLIDQKSFLSCGNILSGRNSLLKDKQLVLKNDPNIFDATRPADKESTKFDKGDVAEEEHFRKIPLRKDQLSLKEYANLMKKYIADKRLKEAIDVLENRMLKEDRVKPDNFIYDLLITECGRMGYDKKAFQLYNRMKQRSLRVTGPTYTALFNACANSPFPEFALQKAINLRKTMIQKGVHPNEINYNAMVKAFGRCGDMKTAFELVDEMKATKLPMKVQTINHLLQVCCSDKEYGFRHALLVWHNMHRRNISPDVYSFNLMLRCVRDCGIGDMKTTQHVIARILSESRSAIKIKAQKDVLMIEDKPTKAINTIENNEKQEANNTVDKVRDTVDEMPNMLTKLPHLGSLVSLSEVKTPFDRLCLLGGLPAICAEIEAIRVRPDVKTFTQLLDILPPTREAEGEIIEKMKELRIRADTDFFNLLLKRRILRQDKEGVLVCGFYNFFFIIPQSTL